MRKVVIIDDDINVNLRSLALNSELDSAGQAIYQGMRKYYGIYYDLHSPSSLNSYPFISKNNDADIFYFLYQTAIGFERLIKVADKLMIAADKTLSHPGTSHDILKLHNIVAAANLGIKQNISSERFLSLLTDFINTSTRYYNLDDKNNKSPKPVRLLLNYLNEISKPEDKIEIVAASLIREYYLFIRDLCSKINVFTHELRDGSDTSRVIYGACNYTDIFKVFNDEDRATEEYLIALISLHKHKKDLSYFGSALLDIDVLDEAVYTEHDFFDVIKGIKTGRIPDDVIETISAHYGEMSDVDKERRLKMMSIFQAKPAEGLFKDDYYEGGAPGWVWRY